MKQRGVVALPTTILVSILLMLILTALMSMMAGELRQATDADLSVRAYFAAESGVEQAVLKVRQGFHSDQACTTINLGQATITCQHIAFSASSFTPTVDSDKAYEILIPPGKSFDTVKLSWNLHNNGSDPLNTNAIVPFTGVASGVAPPYEASAPWDFPAVMEFTIVDFPATVNAGPGCIAGTGQAGPGKICRLQWVLSPSNGGGTNALTGASAAKRQVITCAVGSSFAPYDCGVSISIGATAAANTRVIRIVPRYWRTTSMKISFFRGGAPVTAIPTDTAEVDVTAKAGDVYRRVVVDLPTTSNNLAAGLDYVLFSSRPLDNTCSVSLLQGINGCD